MLITLTLMICGCTPKLEWKFQCHDFRGRLHEVTAWGSSWLDVATPIRDMQGQVGCVDRELVGS